MFQTKMWRIFFAALGLGLALGLALYSLIIYLDNPRGSMNPAFILALSALGGLLLGFSYYLFFKLALRALTTNFLKRAEPLITRSVRRLPPLWISNEIDILDELLQGASETLKRLDRFSAIAKGIVATLDSQKTLKQIIITAVEALPADGGVLFLRQEEGYAACATYPLKVAQLENIRFRQDEIVPQWHGAEQKPCLMSGAERDPRLHPVFHRVGVRSLLNLPLVAGGRVIGIMSLFNRVASGAFDEYDLHLACLYADLAAVALDNAQQHQKALDTQQELTAILSETTDAVIVLDKGNQVLIFNLAAEHCLQVSAQRMIGQTIQELDTTNLSAVVQNAQAAMQPTVQEIAGPADTVLQASISPVRNVGWVVVMQDITTLKELDRLRTEWMAGVSHDMKNPLTVIQMSAGLLSQVGSLNPDQHQLNRRIQEHTQRLRTLVTSVLELVQQEPDISLQVYPVQLAEVIGEALYQVKPLASAKTQRLMSDLIPDLPPISGDAQLLTRALVNLLSNAVKYTPPEGEITVRVRTGEDNLCVQVMDTGRGIASEVLPHVFERFYRVPGSNTESEGTGLGLAIVKNIIEKHNGRIDVKSTPGQGSIFTVILPAINAEYSITKS